MFLRHSKVFRIIKRRKTIGTLRQTLEFQETALGCDQLERYNRSHDTLKGVSTVISKIDFIYTVKLFHAP